MLISAATTIFGFAPLFIFARHPVALFSDGHPPVLPFGMVSAFIATLVITPACMDLRSCPVRQPRGAPRSIGIRLARSQWVFIHLGGSQVPLYYILRPILKIVYAGALQTTAPSAAPPAGSPVAW